MPDRIEKVAGEVRTAAHELVDEVKKERRTRRLMVTLLAVALVAVALLAWDNRRAADRDRKERDRREQQAEEELTDRLCNAWANRVEDHATLVDYLDAFVGESANGQRFVVGLRAAYAESDAAYARERDLTEARCE